MNRLGAALAAVALLLSACSGELGTPSEPLRVLAPQLPEAVVAEPYNASILATGGLRPYTFTLEAGALPPGIALSGGTLLGTPSEIGSFEFTVSVSDANLASTFEGFTLRVIEVPPPQLTLSPPPTEVQGVTTLRGRVADARQLSALRTLVRYDPERFELVAGSVVAARSDVALFNEVEAGEIRIDLAFLGQPFSGEADLFRFDLTPLAPATVALDTETEFLFGGRHHYARLEEGVAPAEVEPEAEPIQEPDLDGAPETGSEP